MTAAAVAADTVPGSGLRKQLEDALAAKSTLQARVAELEIDRRGLVLNLRALRVDPRVADWPAELFVEAVALLDGLHRTLVAAGVDDADVAEALGELPAAACWLVASVWRRQGKLPAEPTPVPSRRLTAVTA